MYTLKLFVNENLVDFYQTACKKAKKTIMDSWQSHYGGGGNLVYIDVSYNEI